MDGTPNAAGEILVRIGKEKDDLVVLRPSLRAAMNIEKLTGKKNRELIQSFADSSATTEDAVLIFDQAARAGGSPKEFTIADNSYLGVMELHLSAAEFLRSLTIGGRATVTPTPAGDGNPP